MGGSGIICKQCPPWCQELVCFCKCSSCFANFYLQCWSHPFFSPSMHAFRLSFSSASLKHGHTLHRHLALGYLPASMWALFGAFILFPIHALKCCFPVNLVTTSYHFTHTHRTFNITRTLDKIKQYTRSCVDVSVFAVLAVQPMLWGWLAFVHLFSSLYCEQRC